MTFPIWELLCRVCSQSQNWSPISWGWKGPLQVILPNPNCVSYIIAQIGYALVKWLGNRGLLPTICFPDGRDSPWAVSGKEAAKTGVSGQNQPRPLPCPEAGARQAWAPGFDSSARLYKGLPISEAGGLKKCREKQRHQATKQPGGRIESEHKSTSPYHTVLQEQYFDTTLFISQRKYKEGLNLIVIFSSSTKDPRNSNY